MFRDVRRMVEQRGGNDRRGAHQETGTEAQLSSATKRVELRSKIISGVISALIVGAVIALPGAVLAADGPCGVNSNAIVCENSKTGIPLDDWYGDPSWGDIEGFTTKVSVQPGESLKLKVNSPTTFTVTFIRL